MPHALCCSAMCWKQSANTLPSAFEQLFAERGLPHGAPSGQLETSRPNSWHDRFTLNSGLDRNDTIMSATCQNRSRAPQQILAPFVASPGWAEEPRLNRPFADGVYRRSRGEMYRSETANAVSAVRLFIASFEKMLCR